MGVAARICCLDLDTFFVSVERLLDPSLEGRPVIIGGRPGSRGVVTACSYEVRALGVRSGMSLTEAARLAPSATYLPTRNGVYGPYAERVREIADRYSPIVRAASIDEMYIDFAGCERLYRAPEDASDDATILRTVKRLTSDIRSDVGLPASAGIGTTRTMAKVACGLAKPEGVRLVAAGQEAEVLAPLPVRKLPGIGPAAEARLQALGLKTLGEVAAAPLEVLRAALGPWAEDVKRRARGEGRPGLSDRERPAFFEHDVDGEIIGSISNERTFREDVSDPGVLDSMLSSLCERVCWRARRRGVRGRTVTLKLRFEDFDTLTRSRTLATPTDSELVVHPLVRTLFAEAHEAKEAEPGRRGRRPRLTRRAGRQRRVRLLGVALSNLELVSQLPLFPGPEPLHRTVDAIRARFGYGAVGWALGYRRRRDHE